MKTVSIKYIFGLKNDCYHYLHAELSFLHPISPSAKLCTSITLFVFWLDVFAFYYSPVSCDPWFYMPLNLTYFTCLVFYVLLCFTSFTYHRPYLFSCLMCPLLAPSASRLLTHTHASCVFTCAHALCVLRPIVPSCLVRTSGFFSNFYSKKSLYRDIIKKLFHAVIIVFK